jgi:branched-subunit amino acid ABC-type transport system permease component
MDDLIGLIWAGVVSGCLYAMGAIGIVLIYKSSNVVNFAHGNLAGLAAFLVFGFTAGLFANMAWGAAVLLTLAIMVAVMAVSYFLIAPLVFKSDLTSTIATLGVGLIAQGATQLLFGSNVVSLDLPLPKWRGEMGPVIVTAYDLAVLGTTAVAIGLLYLLIERTRIGVAFRAVSANPFASRVCGLNLRRVHLFSCVAADCAHHLSVFDQRVVLHAASLCGGGGGRVQQPAGRGAGRHFHRRDHESAVVLRRRRIQQQLSAADDSAGAQCLPQGRAGHTRRCPCLV